MYHPLAWTAREAYAFLKEVPVLEAAGVSVRVPDWWTPRAPPRPGPMQENSAPSLRPILSEQRFANALTSTFTGGRWGFRTLDLCRVKAAL